MIMDMLMNSICALLQISVLRLPEEGGRAAGAEQPGLSQSHPPGLTLPGNSSHCGGRRPRAGSHANLGGRSSCSGPGVFFAAVSTPPHHLPVCCPLPEELSLGKTSGRRDGGSSISCSGCRVGQTHELQICRFFARGTVCILTSWQALRSQLDDCKNQLLNNVFLLLSLTLCYIICCRKISIWNILNPLEDFVIN